MTPKVDFLTRLFQINEDAKNDIDTTKYESHPAFVADKNRFKKRARIAAGVIAVVLTASWIIESKRNGGEETPED